MARIVFIDADGTEEEVEADEGTSAMRSALVAGVRGIAADCGGEVACATCHVYVDDAWLDRVGEPGLDEDDMLDVTACPREPNSRLSCQIRVTPELDGIVLRVPEAQ